MIIAIDHGNYAIKTVNHSFIAGVSEHTVKLYLFVDVPIIFVTAL